MQRTAFAAKFLLLDLVAVPGKDDAVKHNFFTIFQKRGIANTLR